MRHRMIFLILIAVLLAGCQAKSTTQVEQFSASPAPSTTVASAAKDTAAVATLPPETAAPETAEPVAQAAPPGCTVISPPPTPGATAESLFPAVSETDWVSGPEGATLTFIEYSDFQ